MTIKHISFDVWNTLITANPGYASARSEIIALLAGVSKEEAAQAYTAMKKLLDDRAEKNLLCADTTYAWRKLGEQFGLTEDKIIAMQQMCQDAFREYVPQFNYELIDEFIKLENLGYELSIKSNTNFISGRIISEVVGFDRMPWWSFMHFSDHYQMCKPDVLFFDLTLQCSRLPVLAPSWILHVGDSEVFDGACVDIGFKFCHVKNPQDLLEKLKKGEVV